MFRENFEKIDYVIEIKIKDGWSLCRLNSSKSKLFWKIRKSSIRTDCHFVSWIEHAQSNSFDWNVKFECLVAMDAHDTTHQYSSYTRPSWNVQQTTYLIWRSGNKKGRYTSDEVSGEAEGKDVRWIFFKRGYDTIAGHWGTVVVKD